jgi:alanine racemase
VEISTHFLEENFRVLAAAAAVVTPRNAPRRDAVELLAIVKADAYGHSLALCAPAAVRAGARWLGVTSVEEGVAARGLCTQAGAAETEILVIGGVFPGQGREVLASKLTAVVWDVEQLNELEAAAYESGCAAGAVPVHLELDTGMSRQGVRFEEMEPLLGRLRDGSPLRVSGLMTHLYAADESDGAVTRGQFAELERMVARVYASGMDPEWLQAGNSAAVLAGEPLGELAGLCMRYGLRPMVRPGLALYGLAPEFSPEEPESAAALRPRLRRVLEWKTRVVSVGSIAAGTAVGYNGTFVATEPMRLALLAVGYADGLNRALSNCGWVLIRGHRAPITGRISMDQTVVDVTDIPGVAAGDEVVLLGHQSGDRITAEEHAVWAKTIPWEIFTSITARVERIKA